jgi:hypothetical protein
MTDFDIKMILLITARKDRWLPRTLSLSFWGSELRGRNCIMDYAIPDKNHIDVIVSPTQRLLVCDTHQNWSEYMFGEEDTIKTFLAALTFNRISIDNLVVLGDGCEQEQKTF